jgi:thioredoxin 1
MSKRLLINALVVLAVLAGVAGVALFRTSRTGAARAASKLPRVVDVGSDKCKACKELAPILEELKKEFTGRATVDFIDAWKEPKAAEPYQVRVIPTQIFFDKDGKEVYRHEGFLSEDEIVRRFKEMGVK